MKESYEIKVSKLSKLMCKTAYEVKLKQRWEMVRGEVFERWRSGVNLGRQIWRWEKKYVVQGEIGKD